jgi:gas vesicle protein GvpA/GvpJ/GvpM family
MSPDVSLVDLLDRLLSDGVVLTGDITLAIADVDLVHISLRALITSISTLSVGDPVAAIWIPPVR